MSNMTRMWLRFGFALVVALTITIVDAVFQRSSYVADLDKFSSKKIQPYLQQIFPLSFFGTSENALHDTLAIKKRADELNRRNWLELTSPSPTLRLAIIAAGPVEIDVERQEEKNHSIKVPVWTGNRQVVFIIISELPPLFTSRALWVASFTLILGLALAWKLPHPTAINAYPLARDMGLILDRKVSAGMSWGSHRLMHLGGGGQLPGIPDNSYAACNAPSLRASCFDGIELAYSALRIRMLHTFLDRDLGNQFNEEMESGLKRAKQLLQNESPEIWGEFSVNDTFRPFVRDEVLGFALLSVSDLSLLNELTDLPTDRVVVTSPPAWLIGGYEIYYPKAFLTKLIDEIHSGMLSGFKATFDQIRISANPESAFISIDFIASQSSLNDAHAKRIAQYIKRPFNGGLHRMTMQMKGFGRLLIFDANHGFDTTFRVPSESRSDTGLVCRLDFRRIRPEELRAVRKFIKIKGA